MVSGLGVADAAARVVEVVVRVLSGVVDWSFAPHKGVTSGPGMMYVVGLRKMLMVMPGRSLLYQFIGVDPPTSSSVPSPVTWRLVQ